MPFSSETEISIHSCATAMTFLMRRRFLERLQGLIERKAGGDEGADGVGQRCMNSPRSRMAA